jgi:NADP-dependent 3-hydroxy acid dehydrogenase YdfG
LKTVIISGGTSGIGKAAVMKLLEDGFNIATFSRNPAKCRILEKELSTKYDPSRFLIIPADVTDKKSLTLFINDVLDKYSNIDILVNNAGVGYFSDCDDLDDGQFDSMIQTNLVGIAMLTSIVVPYMKKKKSGQIINIASMSGKRSYPRGEFYSATKFAVMGYSDGIRKESLQ